MSATALQFHRTYGVATNIQFSTENSAGTDLLTAAASVFDAGDFKITKDGGALANTTNLPTQITAGQPGYQIALTATEMQADEILITGRDVATGSYQPVIIGITTRLKLGTIKADATQVGSNVAGIHGIGNGTGSGIVGEGGTNGAGIYGLGVGSGNGLHCQGGVTDGDGIYAAAGAGSQAQGINAQGSGEGSGILCSAGVDGHGLAGRGGTNDGYGASFSALAAGQPGMKCIGVTTGPGIEAEGGNNGNGLRCIGNNTGDGIEAFGGANSTGGIVGIGGANTGAGIVGDGQGANFGFQGVSDTGKVTNFFSGELLEDINAVPTPGTTNLSQAFAALIARFYYLVTQTSTQQKQYKSDSATLVGTSTVSDDGVTQTKGRSA